MPDRWPAMWQRLIRSRVVVEDKMMSAKVRTILYAGGVAGLAVVLVQAIVLPAPRLACSEKKHDFGVVPFKGTVRHTFFLQNVGGSPLRFSNIETSCGCIKADLTKHVIKRDEPCELNVDLVLDDQPNLVSGRITIESNDPGSPKTVFSVTANPGHKLMISPSLIDMGTLVYGSVAGRSGEVEVLCREPKALSLQVEDIMSPSALWARLSNVDGPGRPRL